MIAPKVKYWSSSPRLASPAGYVSCGHEHLVLMTVDEKTVQIAKCISGVVSKRIAELLDKDDGQ